ncbi:hypothetical protein TNCV_369421 [Trichonephila clavipes]|nr:hypothetical protein TNCV_369421 [Trichonephila clavipes]
MRKKERGMADFAFDENSEIFLVRWKDNSTVPIASNFSILESFFDVKRRKTNVVVKKRAEKENQEHTGANVTKRFTRLALDLSTKIRVKFN